MPCSLKVWTLKAGSWDHTGTIGLLVVGTPFLVIMQKRWNHLQHTDYPSDFSSSQQLVKALTLESHRIFCNDLLYPAAPSTPGPALQCGEAGVEGKTPQLLEKGDKAPRPLRSRLRAAELNATPFGAQCPLTQIQFRVQAVPALRTHSAPVTIGERWPCRKDQLKLLLSPDPIRRVFVASKLGSEEMKPPHSEGSQRGLPVSRRP